MPRVGPKADRSQVTRLAISAPRSPADHGIHEATRDRVTGDSGSIR